MFVLSYLVPVLTTHECILEVACCIAKQQICNMKWFVVFWGCCLFSFDSFLSVAVSPSASSQPHLSFSPLIAHFLSLIIFRLYISLLCALIVADITFNLSLLLRACAANLPILIWFSLAELNWSQLLSMEDPQRNLAYPFSELLTVWPHLFVHIYAQTFHISTQWHAPTYTYPNPPHSQ